MAQPHLKYMYIVHGLTQPSTFLISRSLLIRPSFPLPPPPPPSVIFIGKRKSILRPHPRFSSVASDENVSS